MASIRPHKSGFRAEVCVDGRRKSKVFDTKGRAKAWAEYTEKKLRGWLDPDAEVKTLGDAFKRFGEEISPQRKGNRWEQARLGKLRRDEIASIQLASLSPQDLASWRDRRLQEVSAGSVRREMALMAGVISYCLKEWGWIDRSPLALVRKPPAPKHRDRLISPAEQQALTSALPAKIATLFQLALETGMRLGELCSIQARCVRERYVVLEDTKNGTSRSVPLSTKARVLLHSLGNEIQISPEYVSRQFGQTCKHLQIKDLRFHDTRHTACVNLAKKLSVVELARMLGMKDTKTLMVYFSESPEAIADKLG
jgi:integrase